ncbi:hypothetical protein Holit_01561 [Hollandina sp. SP2]
MKNEKSVVQNLQFPMNQRFANNRLKTKNVDFIKKAAFFGDLCRTNVSENQGGSRTSPR